MIEPEGKPDMGSVTLSALNLLRLTEVEVHSRDLDLGLSGWDERFEMPRCRSGSSDSGQGQE